MPTSMRILESSVSIDRLQLILFSFFAGMAIRFSVARERAPSAGESDYTCDFIGHSIPFHLRGLFSLLFYRCCQLVLLGLLFAFYLNIYASFTSFSGEKFSSNKKWNVRAKNVLNMQSHSKNEAKTAPPRTQTDDDSVWQRPLAIQPVGVDLLWATSIYWLHWQIQRRTVEFVRHQVFREEAECSYFMRNTRKRTNDYDDRRRHGVLCMRILYLHNKRTDSRWYYTYWYDPKWVMRYMCSWFLSPSVSHTHSPSPSQSKKISNP